jgi:hypothetical protein
MRCPEKKGEVIKQDASGIQKLRSDEMKSRLFYVCSLIIILFAISNVHAESNNGIFNKVKSPENSKWIIAMDENSEGGVKLVFSTDGGKKYITIDERDGISEKTQFEWSPGGKYILIVQPMYEEDDDVIFKKEKGYWHAYASLYSPSRKIAVDGAELESKADYNAIYFKWKKDNVISVKSWNAEKQAERTFDVNIDKLFKNKAGAINASEKHKL